MVRVKLVGSFVSYAQTDEIELDIPEQITIRGLIERISNSKTGEKLVKMMLDPELNDPRPNTIIIINGREIGTLNGLDTRVSKNDVVTMLPVSHGG